MVPKLYSCRFLFTVATLGIVASVPAVGRKKGMVDPRVREVRSVFIKGNNEAAVKARDDLSRRRCLRLAKNAGAADATPEFSQQQSLSERGTWRRASMTRASPADYRPLYPVRLGCL
jgi:hypothetical protein